jgi:hypothetical protein
VGLYQLALKDVLSWLLRLAQEIVSQDAIYQLRQALAAALRLALKRDSNVQLDIDRHLCQELTSSLKALHQQNPRVVVVLAAISLRLLASDAVFDIYSLQYPLASAGF